MRHYFEHKELHGIIALYILSRVQVACSLALWEIELQQYELRKKSFNFYIFKIPCAQPQKYADIHADLCRDALLCSAKY